jgi:hypothetical protein
MTRPDGWDLSELETRFESDIESNRAAEGNQSELASSLVVTTLEWLTDILGHMAADLAWKKDQQ